MKNNRMKLAILSIIIYGASLQAAEKIPFKLKNRSNYTCDVVLVTDKQVTPQEKIGIRGIIARWEIPQKLYLKPETQESWSEFTFDQKKGRLAHVILKVSRGQSKLLPQKGTKNNLVAKNINIQSNISPPEPTTSITTPPTPPTPPAPPSKKLNNCADMPKDEWITIGVKNNWLGAGMESSQSRPEDLQKQLDKEALDKVIKKVSDAQISTDKLPIIKEAISAFWEDAGRGQKTSIKMLPNYIFRALEEGDDAATIAGMLSLWLGMPENARNAWRGEKAEKIGAFLEERVRLSRQLRIPTKPDTPEKIKPKRPKKDTRPLEQQAKEWDENKLNMEISKRRFAISGGPFGEKDPQKIEAIEKEIEMLENILENK